MKDAILALFVSRKFYLLTLPVLVCTVLAATKQIPVAELGHTIVGMSSLLATLIAAEDVATKWNAPPPGGLS